MNGIDTKGGEMADNELLGLPGLGTAVGLNMTAAGWSAVLNNPYFGTQWTFYRSPITGLAGPAPAIAENLTNLGIAYNVVDQVPQNAVTRAEALAQRLTLTDAVTASNTGIINNFNGAAAEAQAGVDATNAGATWIADQRFPASGGWPGNLPPTSATQVDGIGVSDSWWSGQRNIQYEVTVGSKSGAIGQAVFDSQNIAVETNLARSMGYFGPLSSNGQSMLVPATDVAASNLAYGAGQLMRGGGILAGILGFGWMGYDQWDAFVADGYQWGSQSQQVGTSNAIGLGVGFGVPALTGLGSLAVGGTFAAGFSTGGLLLLPMGVAAVIGYVADKIPPAPDAGYAYWGPVTVQQRNTPGLIAPDASTLNPFLGPAPGSLNAFNPVESSNVPASLLAGNPAPALTDADKLAGLGISVTPDYSGSGILWDISSRSGLLGVIDGWGSIFSPYGGSALGRVGENGPQDASGILNYLERLYGFAGVNLSAAINSAVAANLSGVNPFAGIGSINAFNIPSSIINVDVLGFGGDGGDKFGAHIRVRRGDEALRTAYGRSSKTHAAVTAKHTATIKPANLPSATGSNASTADGRRHQGSV